MRETHSLQQQPDSEKKDPRRRVADPTSAEQHAVPVRGRPDLRRRLSPRQVLGLQRAVGNRAVRRMLAPNIVQRIPLDSVDPSADNFWSELANATETQLDNFLEDFDSAIDQFSDDILSGDNSDPSAGFVLDTGLTIIGLMPGGNYIGAIAGIARGAYKLIPPGENVSISTFSNQVRRNIETLRDAVTDHQATAELDGETVEIGVFAMIEEAERNEGGAANEAERLRVRNQIQQGVSRLPGMREFQQALVTDWINSTQDAPWYTLDVPAAEWGGRDAGLIYASMKRFVDWHGQPTSGWLVGDNRPFLEDVANPGGTINALKNAYGADTPLDRLPIPMHMTIKDLYTGGRVHRRARGINDGPAESTGGALAEPRWRHFSGNEALYQDFIASGTRPTINDLVID